MPDWQFWSALGYLTGNMDDITKAAISGRLREAPATLNNNPGPDRVGQKAALMCRVMETRDAGICRCRSASDDNQRPQGDFGDGLFAFRILFHQAFR